MCRSFYRTLFCFFGLGLAGAHPAAGQIRPASPRAEFWGFTGPWDANSTKSVRDHGGKLGAVISGWITIDSASSQPVLPSPYPDTIRPRNGTPDRMAIVTSWHGEPSFPARERNFRRMPSSAFSPPRTRRRRLWHFKPDSTACCKTW